MRTILLWPWAAQASEDDWEALVEASYERTKKDQQALQDKHRLLEFERFDVSGIRRELVFSNAGVPGLIARVILIGSYSRRDRTWLWGWADPSMPPGWAEPVNVVRRHGEKHGFQPLVQPRWSADEMEASEMAAVANHLLNGQGIYRVPNGDRLVFVLITDVRPARP